MLERSRRRIRLPASDTRQPGRHGLSLIVLVVTTSLLLSSGCFARYRQSGEPIPFSRFIEAVADGDLVDEPIIFTPETVSASIRTDQGERRVVATIPPGYDRAELVDELSRQGFEVEGRQ